MQSDIAYLYANLILKARHYCQDNYNYWVQSYSSPSNDDGIAQFKVWQAISQGVLSLVDMPFTDFEMCRTALIDKGETSENDFTRFKNLSQNRKNAIVQEREKFIKFIQAIIPEDLLYVEPLPYHRKLSESESQIIRQRMKQAFDYNGCYWYPLSGEDNKPNMAVVFVSLCNFTSTDEKAVNRYLIQQSINQRFFVVSEDWDDGEMALQVEDEVISELHEGAIFGENFTWLIYGSHEGTITFGSEKLVVFIENLYKNRRAKLNFWEWS